MNRLLALLLALLLCAPVGSARAFDCLTPSDLEDLSERLAQADGALAASDVAAFRASLQGAALLLPCLAEPMRPEVAAEYHRLEGIFHFVQGDREAALQSLAAARRLAPESGLEGAPFAAEHPLALTWATLPSTAPRTRRAAPPREGALLFDGQEAGPYPSRQATMAQLVTDDGAVVWTARVLPGRELPSYEWSLAPERRAWTATAAAGVLTGSLYGSAWVTRYRYVHAVPGLPEATHDRLEITNHALVYASAGAVLGTSALAAWALRLRWLRRHQW